VRGHANSRCAGKLAGSDKLAGPDKLEWPGQTRVARLTPVARFLFLSSRARAQRARDLHFNERSTA